MSTKLLSLSARRHVYVNPRGVLKIGTTGTPKSPGTFLAGLTKGESRKVRKAARAAGLVNVAAAPRESADRVEHVIRNLVNKRKSAADSKSGR